MARPDDTLEQIRRLNPGLHWKNVDRPHRRKECGGGLVKRVRSYLEGLGHL